MCVLFHVFLRLLVSLDFIAWSMLELTIELITKDLALSRLMPRFQLLIHFGNKFLRLISKKKRKLNKY